MHEHCCSDEQKRALRDAIATGGALISVQIILSPPIGSLQVCFVLRSPCQRAKLEARSGCLPKSSMQPSVTGESHGVERRRQCIESFQGPISFSPFIQFLRVKQGLQQRFQKVADQSHSLGNACPNVASRTCKVSATPGYTAAFPGAFSWTTLSSGAWTDLAVCWCKNVGAVQIRRMVDAKGEPFESLHL